jgi:hypothetical protein
VVPGHLRQHLSGIRKHNVYQFCSLAVFKILEMVLKKTDKEKMLKGTVA